MTQIATVVAITGEAILVGVGGQTRALKLGDVIESRETLVTQAGSHVELLLADGQRLALEPGQNLRLDDSLVQTEATPTAQEAALQAATPAGILEMLQQGVDLSSQLEAPAAGSAVVDQEELLKVLQQGGDLQAALDATAAGLTAGGDGGGGSSFVRLLRIVEGIEPLSYSYSIAGLPQIETIELGAVGAAAEVTVSAVTSDRQVEGASLVHTVTLSGVADHELSFAYSLQGVTAAQGSDYTVPPTFSNGVTLVNGQLVVPAGVSSFTITTATVDDVLDENPEYYDLSVGGVAATGTIDDNDTTPLVGDGLSHVSEGGLPVVGIKDDPSDSATDLTGALDLTRNGVVPLTVELVNPGSSEVGTTVLSWAYGLNHAVLIGSDAGGEVIRVTLNGGATDVGSASAALPYAVELSRPIQHLVADEGAAAEDVAILDLKVRISDGVNSPDDGTISILIKDDSPQAHPDADSLSSTLLSPETGNVITGAGTAGGQGGSGADLAGADGGATVLGMVAGASPVTAGVGLGTPVDGAYGRLTMTADGSYSYSLYTSGATVAELKALDVGESRTDTFRYQIKDGDKDTSSTTLTFTVNAVNDPPVVTKANDDLDPTRAGNDLVYERNLPAGTDPSVPPVDAQGRSLDRYATGTITLQDPDGLDDIQAVRFQTTVNGVDQTHDFTAAQLGSITSGVPASYQSFATQNGTVTLLAYNASTGVIGYRFELTSPTTDIQTPVDLVEGNQFTVATRDESPVYSSAVTVTIEVVDDVPKAQRDASVAVPTLLLDESATALLPAVGGQADGIVTDSKNFSGNFKPVVYGADGPASANSLVYSLQLNGSDVESGLYALTSGAAEGKGQQILLTQSGDTIYGKAYGLTYFEISVVASGADAGQVTFTWKGNGNLWHGNTSDPDDPVILNLAEHGDLQLLQRVTDGDGDDARAAIKLGQGVFSIQDDGPAANSFANGQAVDTVGYLWNDNPFGTDGGRSVAITVENSTYSWSKDTNSIAVTGAGGDHGSFNAAAHLLQVELASGQVFSVDMDDGRYKLDLPSGADCQLEVGYTLVDKDGDSVSSTLPFDLKVSLIGGTDTGPKHFTGTDGHDVLIGGDGDDVLSGLDGDDLLVGAKGSDSLTGGLGVDTFVWHLQDQGTGGSIDTLKDFGTGADKLDLRDLLQGEHAGPGGNLEQYLHFSTQGPGAADAVIEVTVNGGNPDGTNPSDMTIVLESVTLAGADDAGKIANLLASHRLVVDY